jgi:hypothetical protein
MQKKLSKIEPRYLFLGGLGLGFGLLAYSGSGEFLKGLASNIAAGFLTTLLTVLLIDKSQEDRIRKEHERVQGIAIRKLARPLNDLIDYFCQIIRVSLKDRPSEEPRKARDFFIPDLVANLDWFDLTAPLGPHVPARWFQQTDLILSMRLEELSSIVANYTPYLPVDLMERLQAINEDSFIRALHAFAGLLGKMNHVFPLAFRDVEKERTAFFEKLIALVECYEREAKTQIILPPEGFARDDVVPLKGSARFKKIPEQSFTISSGIPTPEELCATKTGRKPDCVARLDPR